MQPTMKYDPQADALAIRFTKKPGAQPVTRTLAGSIRGDYVGDELVAIEILNAAQLIDVESLRRIEPAGEELTLVAAEKESKRKAKTLRNLILTGRLKGTKRGRDWVVKRSDLWNYLESLAPTGRPTSHPRAPHRRRKAKR